MRAFITACLLAALLKLAAAFTGEGTAYSAPFDKDATGFNACQFGKLEERWERMYGAMNHIQYPGSCGKCVRVRGIEAGASGKSFIVKIVDRCPTCAYGDVDFSTEALQKITGFSWDRKKISWEFADCGGKDGLSDSEVEEPQATPSPSPPAQKSEPAPAAAKKTSSGKEEAKGTYRDWVVDCEGGRKRCTNLTLASMGYQCMNLRNDSCCLKGNGKDCKTLDSVDEDKSVQWDGAKPASSGSRKLLRLH